MSKTGPLRWVLGVVLALAMVVQSGCLIVAAGAAGAGAVAYVRGELSVTLSEDYQDVIKASNRAITDLDFRKINEKGDAVKTELLARTADDKKVSVVITNIGKDLTRVQIRVGAFGDETISRTLHDKIKARL